MVASKNSRAVLPRVHRVRRRLTDDTVRVHLYHRPTGLPLPALDSPDFQKAYEAAERQWSQQQAAAQGSFTASEPQDQNLSTPQPSRKSPPLAPQLVTKKEARTSGIAPPVRALSVCHRATIGQADIAQIIRAAKQASAAEIEVRVAERATLSILLAQYDGLALIPVEKVCRDYFRHLTVEKFLRKVLAGEINIPVVRIESSQKAAKGIHVADLARYLDKQAEAARKECKQLSRST